MPTLNPTQLEHFVVRCVENRVLLFGAFDLSTNVTKLNRKSKWEEIAQELLAMGAPIKGAAHLRDVSFLFIRWSFDIKLKNCIICC